MHALQGGLQEEALAGRLCGVCQTAFAPGDEAGACPACSSPFHPECWAENGGCAQYGCAHMPALVKDEAPVAPRAHWGQEEKACPECGLQIKAAALRCRHCGAVFASAEPVDAAQARAQARRAERTARGGVAALVLFAAGLLPCTAPLALVGGGLWFLLDRATVRALPSQRRVLAVCGLVAAALTTVLLLATALVYDGGGRSGP